MTFVVVLKARHLTEQRIMIGNIDKQAGFAYMALLVVVFASLLMLTRAMSDIYQTAKREREAQLFFAGEQYQRAIESFYENRFVVIKRYPQSLSELLVDERSIKVQHHLRQIYYDPVSQTKDWGLLLNGQSQIMGVYSRSQGKLLKTHFDAERVRTSNSAGAQQYSDLKFVYLPNSQ
jgi:hypothetical protein